MKPPERASKGCLCCCCSALCRVWLLLCGVLSLVVFAIFAFSLFFEFLLKSLSLSHGQLLALLVAVFIVSKLALWFVLHSVQACWLMAYNVCDANRVPIVEWWRWCQFLWTLLFSVVYLLSVDPDALSEAIVGHTAAKLMLVQGAVWLVLYCIVVLLSSTWLTLKIFRWPSSPACACACLDPYKWRCVASQALCMPFSAHYAQNLSVFENQESSQYSLSALDVVSGRRPHNEWDMAWCRYFRCAVVSTLVLCGCVFIIAGYALGEGWELMLFCGWSFLVYYALIVVLKSDDLDAVVFKMWNGTRFADIFALLKGVSHRHADN